VDGARRGERAAVGERERFAGRLRDHTRCLTRAREQASTTPTTSLPSQNATSRGLVADETPA
jgi:hypothetical protein